MLKLKVGYVYVLRFKLCGLHHITILVPVFFDPFPGHFIMIIMQTLGPEYHPQVWSLQCPLCPRVGIRDSE